MGSLKKENTKKREEKYLIYLLMMILCEVPGTHNFLLKLEMHKQASFGVKFTSTQNCGVWWRQTLCSEHQQRF